MIDYGDIVGFVLFIGCGTVHVEEYVERGCEVDGIAARFVPHVAGGEGWGG